MSIAFRRDSRSPSSADLVRTRWGRIHLPYSFEPVGKRRGKHVYVPVNRDRNMLGDGKLHWTVYEDHVSTHGLVFRDPLEALGGMWVDGKDDLLGAGEATPCSLFLYTSGYERPDYFERLQLLRSMILKRLGYAGNVMS